MNWAINANFDIVGINFSTIYDKELSDASWYSNVKSWTALAGYILQ